MRKGTKAFTIIELLTVIAIIAILSGIIVPVYARVKDNSYRSGDISHMNQLRTSLALYREDQGAYPPALLGYVTLYATGPDAGNVIPADRLQGFLYPKREGSIETFRPAYLKIGNAVPTTAVFPQAASAAVGSDAILDLNGDGAITPADDTTGARQAYGPADGNVCWDPAVNAIAAGPRCAGVATTDPTDPRARVFYAVSGYDTARVPVPGNSTSRYELRYTRFWSNFAIGSGAGFGAGSGVDDPRQLGYSYPPDDTVVTWNSYFREYESAGVPKNIRRDIILFLNGSARPWDSRLLFNDSWRQRTN